MTAVPGTIEARGHTGRVTFDGEVVTIHREGLLARAGVGKGQKTIHVEQITAVQWKPAGAMMNGYVQFSLAGEVAVKSRAGHAITDAARDENSIVFTKKQMASFELLRDAVQAAQQELRRAQRTPTVVAQAGPSAAERIQQLAQLREQGLVSDEEFEAKRQELLAEM